MRNSFKEVVKKIANISCSFLFILVLINATLCAYLHMNYGLFRKERFTIAYVFEQCINICLEIIIASDINIELSISNNDTCSSGVIIDGDVIIISLPVVVCLEITINDDFNISVEIIDSSVFLSFPPSS